jgi:drug/metabolite transporter (DMT)-like permease
MRRPVSAHGGMWISTLIWGANFAVMKYALRDIPPFPFTAIRFASGSLVLVLVLLWLGRLRMPPAGLFRPLLVYGVIGNTIYQLCFISGLARTSATNSALILASLPTMVTISAAFLGLEQPSRSQLWGVAVATVGVILVILGGHSRLQGGSLLGDGLMLAATMLWTAYTLGMRQLSRRLPPIEATAWTLFTGTPGLVIAGIPGLLRVNWTAVTLGAWSGVAYSALLSLSVAYILWSRAIEQLGAGRTAIYSCVIPIVATLVAILLLGEHPTLFHFIGGPLVVGGVLLTQSQPRPLARPETGEEELVS